MGARWKWGMGEVSATLNAAEVHIHYSYMTCFCSDEIHLYFLRILPSDRCFSCLLIFIVWKWKRPHVVSDALQVLRFDMVWFDIVFVHRPLPKH